MHGSTISCSTDMTTGCRPGCRAMRLAIAAVVAVSDRVRRRLALAGQFSAGPRRQGLGSPGCRASRVGSSSAACFQLHGRACLPPARPHVLTFVGRAVHSSGSAPPIVKSIGVMMIILAVLSAVCHHTRQVCIPAGTLCAAVVCVYVCVCVSHTLYAYI